MIYFSTALLVVAIGLVVLRVTERRSQKRRMLTHVIIAIIVFAVGISSMIQIYRIGDAGAQSVWGGEIARLKKANGTQQWGEPLRFAETPTHLTLSATRAHASLPYPRGFQGRR